MSEETPLALILINHTLLIMNLRAAFSDSFLFLLVVCCIESLPLLYSDYYHPPELKAPLGVRSPNTIVTYLMVGE